VTSVATSVATRHGRIAVIDTRGAGPAVLFIHGNSACKEIFRHQIESDLARRFRLVAFDLPGHGASDDARDPALTYGFRGYAEVAIDVMSALGLARPVVVGWSLGGHVAIELLTHDVALAGILLTGTPPVGAEDMGEGFRPHPHMGLTGKRTFTEEDIRAYARETAGIEADFIEAAVRRTDGRAREQMLASALAPGAPNQRALIERTRVPTAVVTGTDEPFVNNDYLDRIPWGNLWGGRVFRIEGAGHAPFFERPAAFNALLDRFVADTR
jgi:pimeloyl-ACP methyl ester carboxylesterase